MRRSRSSALALLVMLGACHAPPMGPHACPAGPVVLAGQADVAGLRGCPTVASLTIRTGMTLELAPLASLVTIRGDLTIGPSIGLEEVSFVGLETVGGTVKVASNTMLHGLFLPKLTHASAVIVVGNVALATLSMPRLAAVDGELTVADASDLELIEASNLSTLGGPLTIRNAPELALVELGALVHVTAVAIEGVGKLPVEARDRLRVLAAAPEKSQ